MSILSWAFWGLTLTGALIYWALPAKWRRAWLLVLSLAFALAWGWFPALLLTGVGLLTWALGRRPAVWGPWLGALLNLGLLLTFKLQGYFLEPLAALTGLNPATLALLAPLGLSFYSVQAVSYLVDVRRGQMPALASPLDVLLYLAYFPKFLSGPLERARLFVPRLAVSGPPQAAQVQQAFGLAALGLLRKAVLADGLFAMIPDNAFWAHESGLVTWLVAYAFALYNDFAGYTDLMRAASLLFGIELSRNFEQPFFARNFAEFWNRWHISLSHWLRDYVYFPVRRALAKGLPSSVVLVHIAVPPLVTMLASGLWHGSAEGGLARMLLWGGLHGLYQAAERLPALWGRARPPQEKPLWLQTLGALTVFVLVSLAWVPFQVGISASLAYWLALLEPSRWWAALPQVWGVALVSLALDAAQTRRGELFFQLWPKWARAFAAAGLALVVFVSLRGLARADFIYAGF
ncbi:MAG: MBOAT family protein [Chloroflexi bacterium]|nr:MBOAT family protein [Chloroflexota bacterium]